MPTYSIRAPNGKTYQIDGPQGATDAQVRAQVLKQFPGAGGAPPPAPPKQPVKPATPPEGMGARRLRDFGKFANATPEQATTAMEFAENRFRETMRTKGIQGSTLDAALQRFRSDPGFQALAMRAQGRTPQLTEAGRARLTGVRTPPTKRQQIRAAAEQAAGAPGSSGAGDFLTALNAGARRYMFGIPERLAAAGLYATQKGNNTYQDVLQLVRDKTDVEMERSTAGTLTGGVIGSVASGRAVTGALAPLVSRAAASASPLLARAGNYLQTLGTFQKGQKFANAAKLAGTGAAFGAAQGAGDGSGAGRGAAYGAAGGVLLGGGFKAAQVITRPFRDFLRLSSASKILSRLTTSTTDEIAARAAEYRQATGAEPTLFELLPLVDRNKILKQAVVGRDTTVEQASRAIRERAANLGPEMSRRAQTILQPQRTFVERGIRRDLTAARGGVVDPADEAVAAAAIKSPTDMSALRDVEARQIMAPFENTRVVGNLDELYPSVPAPGGAGRIATDPEVSAVIRSAAGTLRQRADGAGVTAGDITDMISTLRSDLSRGGIEGRTAERAISHLQRTLDQQAPDAGAAARAMTEAYAARSRMAEGMQEGAATRTRDSVQVGTSRREARRVRNAYDTPEGDAGRVLGQGNKILGDLTGSPEEALRATVGISRNSNREPLRANLGEDAGDAIRAAARAQDESAQALAAASKTAQSGGQTADAETLVSALAGLHPSSFITTKAGAVRQLLDMTYIPANRARTMVDMIFSQDPATVARAIRALGNESNGAAAMRALTALVGQGASAGTTPPPDVDTGVADGGADPALVPPPEEIPDPNAEIDPPVDPNVDPNADPNIDPNLPYGHAVVSSIFPEAEITEDVRDPDSDLGRKNPGSYHVKSQNGVDVRPIPGMTFDEFIARIEAEGHTIIEARDEVNNPVSYATGPHWHVVIADA